MTLKTSEQQDARLLKLAVGLEKAGGMSIVWKERNIPYREAADDYHLLENSCLNVSLNLMLDFVAGEARLPADRALVDGLRQRIADISARSPEAKFGELADHQKDLQGIVDRARATEGVPLSDMPRRP